MRDCSFASVDRCHQLTLSKKKGLRNVEEDEKTVLGLRSNLPETDIQTVCYHHEQSLIARFSRHIKKCSDPFSLHSKGSVTKSLCTVTLDFYSKTTSLKGIIAPGEKLCISCKKQAVIKSEENLLVNKFKDATADNDKDLTTAAGPSRLSGEENTSASGSTKSDVANLEAEISLHDTNAVLQILGETPVKTSKY